MKSSILKHCNIAPAAPVAVTVGFGGQVFLKPENQVLKTLALQTTKARRAFGEGVQPESTFYAYKMPHS